MTTKAEKQYHDHVASLGCIACMKDGNFNDYVSIHHVAGRTAQGCQAKVLALCAGHHQKGTGQDKTMIAVHPDKARFEAKYGTQQFLMQITNELLKQRGLIK